MLPAFSSRHLGVSTLPSLPPRVSLLYGGEGRRLKKSLVLPLKPRTPQSPPAPVRASRAPRALCRRSPPCCRARRSAGRAPRSPRGCPGSARRPPKRCQDAAQKFTARPGPERSPRSRAPAAPTPPRAPPRQPPTAPPQASRRHPRGGWRSPRGLAPLRPASGPRRAYLNFGGRWPLGAAGWGGEPPTGPQAVPARLPAPFIRRASRGALAARWRRRQRRAGRVCGPAPYHVSTSHPPGRAHGPSRERVSAHAPRCLPPLEAAARRAGAGRWRKKVPAGGPAAARRRAPGPQLRPALATLGRDLQGAPLSRARGPHGEAFP